MKMDLEYNKGIFFIRLKGRFERKYCPKINNYVIPVIKKHHIKNCIVNLEKLTNIEECGIDAILRMKCTMKKNNGHIYLCHIPEELVLKFKRLHIKCASSELAALKMIEV